MGEQDGEVLFHPDEAITGAIRTAFERFAEFGSARRVWLWFRSEGLSFPLQTTPAGLPGPNTALHHILTNPVYAGAYTYGKTKYERYVVEHGAVQETDSASAHGAVGRSHPGPSSRLHRWATFQANQLIDRTREPLNLDHVRTIFGDEKHPHYDKRKRNPTRWGVVIEKPAHDVTMFKVHYGKMTLKIYTKGERALRIEVIVHNIREYRWGRSLPCFPRSSPVCGGFSRAF